MSKTVTCFHGCFQFGSPKAIRAMFIGQGADPEDDLKGNGGRRASIASTAASSAAEESRTTDTSGRVLLVRAYDPSRDGIRVSEDPRCTAATLPMVRAFAEDPLLTTYSFGLPDEVIPCIIENFLWMLHSSYEMCDVVTLENGEIVAGAMWEPGPDSLGALLRLLVMFQRFLRTGGWWRFKRALGLLLRMESERKALAPTAYHLQLLATSPDHQGMGIGGELIQHGLARADKLGVPAYLESSNPRNVPFYQRHGFRILKEIYPAEGYDDVPGRGPVVTLMLREPRNGAA